MSQDDEVLHLRAQVEQLRRLVLASAQRESQAEAKLKQMKASCRCGSRRRTGRKPAPAGTTPKPYSEAYYTMERFRETYPGEWKVLQTFNDPNSAATMASQMRAGVRKSPNGLWDVCSKGVQVWVRFIEDRPAAEFIQTGRRKKYLQNVPPWVQTNEDETEQETVQRCVARLEYLLGGKGALSRREMQRYTVHLFASGVINQALDQMIASGGVKRIDPPPGGRGRPAVKYQLLELKENDAAQHTIHSA